MLKPIRKAVFPVGGLGTRFLPSTKAIPKEMLPVANKPLIQHVFEEAVQAGIEEFIFITGRNKNAINNHFNHAFELQSILLKNKKTDLLHEVSHWMPGIGQIAFIPQRETKGLGHAIHCARNFIGEDEYFAVLLADELVLGKEGALFQMVDVFNNIKGANILAVSEVPIEETNKYGILISDGEKDNLIRSRGMVEKPKPSESPSNLSLTGRYILHSDIFKYIEKDINKEVGEIQITDAIDLMAKDKKYDFYGFKFQGDRFDCGSPVGFLEANIAYSLKDDKISADVKKMLAKYQKYTKS